MISAMLSIIIVNLLYKLYAKLIGADVMFFNTKKNWSLCSLVVDSVCNYRYLKKCGEEIRHIFLINFHQE